MRFTLDDLLNADTKGRWWLVGSAWKGHIHTHSVDGEEKAAQSTSTEDTEDQAQEDTRGGKNLLSLARAQRMNTDFRRSVFCLIMSAEVGG